MLIGTLYLILATSCIIAVVIEVIGSLGDNSAAIPDKLSGGAPGLQDPDNNFDVSMWLFSPDRTVEELDQFARTGVIPHVSPKPDKGNFSVQDNQLFTGNGREWVPVATPGTIQHYPTHKKLSRDQMTLLREMVMDKALEHKLPVFIDKIGEKRWCASIMSSILECRISVEEDSEMGYITINTANESRTMKHGVVNWGWHSKGVQEFNGHLLDMWLLTAGDREKREVFVGLLKSVTKDRLDKAISREISTKLDEIKSHQYVVKEGNNGR